MSQISFTLSRRQAAVMYKMLVAGAVHFHRTEALTPAEQDHARRAMERVERRFAIHNLDVDAALAISAQSPPPVG